MLLFRLSRLWYCPLFRTNNTVAHANVYTRTRKRVYHNYIHTMSILCRIVLEYMNLPDSDKPKQSA